MIPHELELALEFCLSILPCQNIWLVTSGFFPQQKVEALTHMVIIYRINGPVKYVFAWLCSVEATLYHPFRNCY
jgi:hypothetical protein